MVAVAVAAALTGCSVPSHGWMGLLRGEGDSLSAVVQMCEFILGSTIYTVDGPGAKTIARAEFDDPGDRHWGHRNRARGLRPEVDPSPVRMDSLKYLIRVGAKVHSRRHRCG